MQETESLLQEWMDFLKNVKGKPYYDILPSNDRVKVMCAHLINCVVSKCVVIREENYAISCGREYPYSIGPGYGAGM